MKRLTCEMCGNTDLVKDGGVFVCQTCGCKYSVEEAKKMMVEGVVEVSGTVQVDNTNKLSNYKELAEAAVKRDNYSEAEEYSNKILEIDIHDCYAWAVKGKAACKLSSIAEDRTGEAVECFINCIKETPVEAQDAARQMAYENISYISLAMIKRSSELYAEYRSAENADILRDKMIAALKNFGSLEVWCNKSRNDTWGIIDSMCGFINGGIVDAASCESHEYWYSGYHPTEREAIRRRTVIQRNVGLYEFIAGIVVNMTMKEQFVNNAITLLEDDRDLKAEEYISGADYWRRYEVSTSAYKAEINSRIQGFRRFIEEQKQEAREKEAKERKERIDRYWEARAEERVALENEKDQIEQKINELNKAADEVPGLREIEARKDRRSRAEVERNSLGFFQRKEKTRLDEEIRRISDQIYDLENERRNKQSEIRKEIRPLLARKKEIEQELTKDRPE